MNFLDEAKEELVIYIGVDDEIPYKLWKIESNKEAFL